MAFFKKASLSTRGTFGILPFSAFIPYAVSIIYYSGSRTF